MAEIKPVAPVIPIIGLLFTEAIELAILDQELTPHLGPVTIHSDKIPFTHTEYYNEEMGNTLFRQWQAYAKEILPDELASIKIITNEIEKRFLNDKQGRKFNIDPGYISLSNLVLASTKNYSHRIYLDQGIYAEVTLIFKHGHFTPVDWTYPDYKEPLALEFFEKVRERLKRKNL